MVRRIPPDAYEQYLEMGTDRSYQVLADRYGVSKTAIVKRAKKEGWQERIRVSVQLPEGRRARRARSVRSQYR